MRKEFDCSLSEPYNSDKLSWICDFDYDFYFDDILDHHIPGYPAGHLITSFLRCMYLILLTTPLRNPLALETPY